MCYSTLNLGLFQLLKIILNCLRVIISKHQKIAIMAENDVSDFPGTVRLFSLCRVMNKSRRFSSVSMSVSMATKIFYF